MSISSNILSGDFTADYRDKYLQNFRNIEKINYYIHDDYTLLDYAGNWSWEHWDGHQRFIEDVFISIDPLIDLDFSRTTDRSKAHIEIYQVSPESPFTDDGLLGQALGSHQVDNLNLIGFPKSKSFGFYRMAAWSMASDLSPFLDDQKKYDLVEFDHAYTILHELGHTLGLSHPQSVGDDPYGDWHNSSDTAMSYNSIPNYDSWGIFSIAPRWTSSDISALQTLWGLENDNKTYTITPSASSINEGSTLTTSIATKNVASGTSLYYTLSGNGITASDFSSGALSGSGLVGPNGAFSFTHVLANDLITEGVETLNIKLFSDSSRANQVSSTASVSIADTSKASPTYTLTPSATTINEGAILTTTVATTNVATGTTLYYVLSGSGITAADFFAGSLTGSATVGTDGRLLISHTLKNDVTTEGIETLNIKLFSDLSHSTQVGSTASVSIVDISKSDSKTYTIRTFTGGQWADTFSEGDSIGVQVNTSNVSDGTVLYFSLSGVGVTAEDFLQGGVELLPVGNVQKGISQFYRQLANDLKTEGTETLYIKIFSDSLRTIEVGSKAVSIVDTSLGGQTYLVTPSAPSINEGSILTTLITTTKVASGTTLYYSLTGVGITPDDFSSNSLLFESAGGAVLGIWGSGAVGTDGKFSISHTLANDFTSEGIEAVEIKIYTHSELRYWQQVGSTAKVSIVDTSLGFKYYSPSTNNTLTSWNIYPVDNSVKAGDIVNQWFGVETPVALQVQDPTELKLLDITTSSWTEKVKINRVAKASDKGDFIEGKQKDCSCTNNVGSVLTGGKGNDSIQAKAGWDMVDGGDGDDLVKTGNGRDILTGGTGRDELWGGFGWNTYKGDKDGFSDLIVIKSDQHLANPTLGNKSGNNSDGLKTDIIENLDSIDRIIIQGVATNQITFASNATAHGLTGIGIYSKGFIEALYTGADLTLAQLTAMTTGDTSAAVMNNTLTSYGVW